MDGATRTHLDTIRSAAEAYLEGTAAQTVLYAALRNGANALRATGDNRAARALAVALAELPQQAAAPEPERAAPASTPRGIIYTDGSAVPNPGEGGWAAVWVDDGRIVREAHGSASEMTNNRMELSALAGALEMAPEDAEIEIVTDSELCVRTITEWAPKWRDAGWRRRRGSIANLELVKRVLELYERHPRCRLRWTRGHAGHRWNEYADRRANEARTAAA